MYHRPFVYFQTEQDTDLIRDIVKAINGEYSAINCYAYLSDVSPTKEERRQILEIRRDEEKHYREFSAIYTKLTGKHPTPRITEQCPENYCEGLDFAFKDEQATVDFYLDISDKVRDPYIKDRFRRAASDEQNHAVWFFYYLMKNECPR